MHFEIYLQFLFTLIFAPQWAYIYSLGIIFQLCWGQNGYMQVHILNIVTNKKDDNMAS